MIIIDELHVDGVDISDISTKEHPSCSVVTHESDEDWTQQYIEGDGEDG